MGNFLDIFILGICCGIFTQYALVSGKKFSAGPFQNRGYSVVIWYGSEQEIRPYGIFDSVRRLFGARYLKTPEGNYDFLWTMAGPWTCVYCLCFWTAALFSVPFSIQNGVSLIDAHLLIMATTVIMARYLDGND